MVYIGTLFYKEFIMQYLKLILTILTFFLFMGCNTNGADSDTNPDPGPDQELSVVTVDVDNSIEYQTIDGFGFFGAYDVWWGSNMWNNSWGDKIISDLGITIWRNEYFPPATPTVGQDADWAKQKPVVQGLKEKADQYGVPLKFIFTVWSPPADMKWECSFSWAGDENATRYPGDVSTKNGGTLNPNMYGDYAAWLNQGIQLYKDIGVDVYAISLQNEPLFSQYFNSCTYTVEWYNELLTNVVPDVKSAYPEVKIFGSENMLEMEGKDENWQWFYHSGIKSDPAASDNIDILAVHGYHDGVSATSGSELAKMWANHTEQFVVPMNKKAWMTETSGYTDQWLKTGNTPGAFNLAMDIYSGLTYGNINAWVWWQGSELDGIGDYNLMQGVTVGKKYAVSKQFYRYIRPGAIRVDASSNDNSVFATAFEHSENGTSTIIVINSSTDDKYLIINGTGMPESYSMYRTTSESDNCSLIKTVQKGSDNKFVLPAQSIITLQAGGDPL